MGKRYQSIEWYRFQWPWVNSSWRRIYRAVALSVDGVPATVEHHVVAVIVGVETADVVAGVVAVGRRAMRVACALPQVVSGTAVPRLVVVAGAVREVTAEHRGARGRVVVRRPLLVTFAVDEILADSRRVVTTANTVTTLDVYTTAEQQQRKYVLIAKHYSRG